MLSHALYRRGHHHQSIASWCLPRRRTLSLSSRARDAVASKRTSRVGSNAPAASTVAAAPAATEVLRNAAGVQLLSDALHRQVFGVQAFPDLDKGAVAISSEHLKRHGLAHEENPVLPTTDFTLPKLQGTNIEEHFYNIGLAHSEPYLNLAKDLARATLPWKPDTWAEVAGWVRYEPDGSFVPISSPPEDEALVFDVESLYKLNNYGVMAVAVSEKHWYGWTSPWLLGQTEEVEQLIPLPGTKPTLIVGHNVGYDRGRIQEEYSLDRTENRFLDTMSLHVAVTGLSSHQRAPWMKYRKEKRAKANAAAAIAQAAESGAGQNGRMWQDYSSMNSLADVAKLHCGIEVDKAARDWFESESRQDITNNFQELMSYCANDVGVTHEVFKVVLPAFLEACPNPVTFAGVLHMGSSFLPVDESWEAFLERAEGLYTSLTKKVEEELHALAEEARKLIYVVGKDGRMMHESDPWLKQLDWSPKNARRVVVDIGDDELALDDRIAAPSKPNIARPSKGLAKEDDGGKANAADTQAVESVEIAPPSSAGAARLFEDELEEPESAATPSAESHIVPTIPRWFTRFYAPATDSVTREGWDRIAPVLLGVRFNGQALRYDKTEGWYFRKSDQSPTSKPFTRASQTVFNKNWLAAFTDGRATSNNNKLAREACNLGVSTRGTARSSQVVHLEKQFLTLAQTVIALSEKERSADDGLSQLDWTAIVRPPKYILPWQNQAADIASKEEAPQHVQQKHSTQSVSTSTESIRSSDRPALFEEADSAEAQPAVGIEVAAASEKDAPTSVALTPAQRARAIWPKWFWDLQGPSGSLTIRSKLAPLLLQLRWKDHPIFSSRQHGWVFRVPAGEVAAEAAERAREAAAKADAGTGDSDLAEEEERYTKRGRGRSKKDKEEPLGPQPVEFSLESDSALALDTEHKYFKLPHKDGEKANVGSPLSKTFIPAFESGTLSSQFEAAAAALDMNAQCSYWTSARDRILKQFVVWATEKNARGFPTDSPRSKHGLILPQVITMGTVTRRAVESTWLAASNAKKNRLGSELKAMIRAPPGYAIVGADVDSEELWICCVMGDAQFGVHGATAIGWMTLEGTKSAGTDLHSKTASILGISRDMAKVFNYSRIYGAGVAHAVQLLMQSNPNLTKQEATEAAKQLYAATKGHKVHSDTNVFRSKFWHGGTESHVFNTLEKIAMAAEPRTPALGCGITAALAKGNLPATEKSKQGEDYMPSRINWVVQSSGVDYLHMLMVSMEYLTKRFDINARFMISVHDEIRYLVKEEDRYRAALALQVSNLWTRALFAHRLQMESLPQSCAWFSAVDLDHVLRKEVNMDCVTPSQPTPIPHGVSQDILATLEHTSAGSLFKNGQPMREEATLPVLPNAAQAAQQPATIPYRATDRFFLLAQDAGTPEALATVIAQKTQQSAGLDYAGGWDLAKDHLEEAARQGQASSASRRPVKSPATPSKKASSVSRSRAAKGTIPQASTKKVPLAANSQPGNRHAADPSSIPGRPKASRYPTDGTKARPASRGLQPPPTRSPSSGFLKRRAPDS